MKLNIRVIRNKVDDFNHSRYTYPMISLVHWVL